jgi:hypothetical protein
MSNGKKIFGMSIYLISIVIVFSFIAVASTFLKLKKVDTKENFPYWQKGMTYVTWNKEGYATFASGESLTKLSQIGVQWVALITTWYQDKYNSTAIFSTHKTPSDESIIYAIDKIHSLGMKVMLKPHLDIIDTSEYKWRADIEFTNDTDWEAWFNSYRDFLLHYAKIAQEHDVELFCIGTELTLPTAVHPDLWREKIIKSVRNVYRGLLTYAANWYEEYSSIKFWDALDYAGIDPYFPLTDKDKPTLEELKKGWEEKLKEIEFWQAKINKPVIFTEIGYKSSIGAAKAPWEHMPGKELDLQQQADCYQVLLETFWEKDWFYGMYWWEWGTNINMGGVSNRGFTPQGKPAQEILSKWYKKPIPKREREPRLSRVMGPITDEKSKR